MVGVSSAELTEDEAELYDRQIRLWGLEAQKRLRNARILVIGCQGFGAEICKNIILAGVKSVVILDSGSLTEEDGCSQFLAPRDQIGKNRAVASLKRAQQLNSMVTVSADTDNVDDKPDSYFAEFDIVCATECTTQQLIRINQICREKLVKFFCGDVFGLFGFMFADLQIHEFVEETKCYPVGESVKGGGEPANKRPKLEPVTVSTKNTLTYVPLQDALQVDWNCEEYIKRLPKIDSSYFLMKVLQRFRDLHGCDPNPIERERDLERLEKLKEDELKKLGVPLDKLPSSMFRSVFAEVSPVCAIMGGVVAQEIIRAVSQNERTHNNMFFFNPEKMVGFVECIGN
ncbi:SUMO-activating enzyme subunit 1 [Anabrus simplex]|uniref:SUMO-activating enzyme subunit 1 n=1 Tax=Anabrus simplex TaxID=316456 RepID=UPI0035A2AE3A